MVSNVLRGHGLAGTCRDAALMACVVVARTAKCSCEGRGPTSASYLSIIDSFVPIIDSYREYVAALFSACLLLTMERLWSAVEKSRGEQSRGSREYRYVMCICI
jgi:hypothetical protein